MGTNIETKRKVESTVNFKKRDSINRGAVARCKQVLKNLTKTDDRYSGRVLPLCEHVKVVLNSFYENKQLKEQYVFKITYETNEVELMDTYTASKK